MRYIISDTHFGHDKIIQYAERPFSDAAEMNNELIRRWNEVVDEDDCVFHLGDVCYPSDSRAIRHWLTELNGDIILVKGNHDTVSDDDFPAHVVTSATIEHDGCEFYLEHQPVGFSGWQIHGHEHNNDLVNYPFIHPGTKRVNVSAELLNYYPIELSRLTHILDSGERHEYISDHETPD